MFFTLPVVAFKFRPVSPTKDYVNILPSLYPVAILQIILPVPFIFSPIHVDAYPKAIGLEIIEYFYFLILPFTFIDVPIYVPEFALSVSIIVLPLTLIPRAVLPGLNALAISH